MGHWWLELGGTDEQESIKTILRAFELGINMIDTAPVYGFGKSEEIVGKAVKQYGHRENIILKIVNQYIKHPVGPEFMAPPL